MSGKYGEVFFKEKPYAVALVPALFAQTKKVCSHCFKLMVIDGKGNRCAGCHYALYCSIECHVSEFFDTIEICMKF